MQQAGGLVALGCSLHATCSYVGLQGAARAALMFSSMAFVARSAEDMRLSSSVGTAPRGMGGAEPPSTLG